MPTVTRIGIEDLVEAKGTPGIRRWQATTSEGFWTGIAEGEPAIASGWHHHGDHDTVVYVLEGRMRIEWGTGPEEAVLGSAGEFLHVPPATVHREVNPDDTPSRVLLLRVGSGPPVVDVDGPPATP